MHRILLSFGLIIFALAGFAQPNYNVTDPEKAYKEAKEFFIKRDYAVAYPLLKKLADKYPPNTEMDHSYINQDLEYYLLTCGLKLQQETAEEKAKAFIESVSNESRSQMMSFHLARYYFSKEDFARAVVYYERAGYANLSNEEIAEAKFELAYSYFKTGDNQQAKPLFNEIHQLTESKYYYDASYYYGYLSYEEGNRKEALRAFKNVESIPKYEGIVPYYIAQLYYFEGNKDAALQYAEKAQSGINTENKKELNLLTGQIYFEKKQFARALPLLENYVQNSEKVSKEVMYELSYCYYEMNEVEKAIEGFKQLSNEQDSLGQNSMYLLGDLYLRTNQKVNARNAFKYSADNSSNRLQQEISRFNYAKLSFELGYNDVALSSMNEFLDLYPSSVYANEAKEILINLLANTNNYSKALELYESFDQPTPTMKRIYPRILFGQATELINEQRLDEADALLTRIINDPFGGTVITLADFWKGEVAYRQGRYDDAVTYLKKYLQYAGAQGEANTRNAHYILGYSYMGLDNFEQAAQNFKQVASNISPSSTNIQQDAYVRLADSYFMLKNYTTAKAMYQNVINSSLPQSDYSLYQLSLINGINNPSEKINTFNSLIQRYPQSDLVPDAYIQIANAYMAQQDFRSAIPYLDKVLTMNSASAQFPKVLLKRALSNYNLLKNAEALADYQKLISQYPQSIEADEALDNMKNIYIEMGKPNEYVEFVNKTGKNISTTEADSLTFASAELKYANNQCDEAIRAFNHYLAQYPNGSHMLEARFYRADCYSKNQKWQVAAQQFDSIVALGSSRFAERAALNSARIYYFDLKDYENAKKAFIKLHDLATTPENQLEALRGLTRAYYQTKDFSKANLTAQELLTKKGISTDDKAIANLVLGKSLQTNGQCEEALKAFKEVAAINKSNWGAEARYEIANCYFILNDLSRSEKAAMEVIKSAGVDYWVAKAYILLGDIYFKQKDYFNAKATFKSVADNAAISELKDEAATKLEKVIAAEKSESKVK